MTISISRNDGLENLFPSIGAVNIPGAQSAAIQSAEEAVLREVKEEAGLTVRDVRYFATQSWPYPYSLMLGYLATADDPTLVPEPAELDEAAWYSREQLRAPDLDIELPRHDSIARRLIDAWIDKA